MTGFKTVWVVSWCGVGEGAVKDGVGCEVVRSAHRGSDGGERYAFKCCARCVWCFVHTLCHGRWENRGIR